MSYPVEGFLEINEDMIQFFIDVGGTSSGSEPSLFFSNYLFGLVFKLVQDEFQHDCLSD